jgi:hypothetical protein
MSRQDLFAMLAALLFLVLALVEALASRYVLIQEGLTR